MLNYFQRIGYLFFILFVFLVFDRGVIDLIPNPAQILYMIAPFYILSFSFLHYRSLTNLIKFLLREIDGVLIRVRIKLKKSNSLIIRNLPILFLIGLLAVTLLFSNPEYTYWDILLFRIRNKLKVVVEILTAIYAFTLFLANRKSVILPKKSKRYHINRVDIAIIILITLVGLLLRIPNIGYLDPYIDEYHHLNAAKQLFETGSAEGLYERSFYLVTLPVFVGFELLGMSLSSGRIVGALFNLMAIAPLYLIGLRIDRKFSVILTLLYVTNPWITATARTVREYAYFPVIFYLVLLAGLGFLETIPNNFYLIKDYRRILTRINVARILFLIGVGVYAIFINSYSTLKIIGISYLIFGIFFFLKLGLSRKYKVIIVGCAVLSTVLVTNYFIPGGSFLALMPKFDPYWLRFFFPASENQWYGGYRLFTALIVGFTSLYYSAIKFRHLLPLLTASSFFIYLYFFTFHFDRYYRPRYALSIQFWYILFIGLGLYAVLKLIQNNKSRTLSLIMTVLVLLNFADFKAIVKPVQMFDHGYVPITREFHDPVKNLKRFIENDLAQKYDVCYTTFNEFFTWNDLDPCKNYLAFRYRDDYLPNAIYELTQFYDSGLIILDYRRGQVWAIKTLPLANFTINDIQVRFLGEIDRNQLYEFTK